MHLKQSKVGGVHAPGWHFSFSRHWHTMHSSIVQALDVLRWHKRILLDPLQAGKRSPEIIQWASFAQDKWTSRSPWSKGRTGQILLPLSQRLLTEWGPSSAGAVQTLALDTCGKHSLLPLLYQQPPFLACWGQVHSLPAAASLLAEVSMATGRSWKWASCEPGQAGVPWALYSKPPSTQRCSKTKAILQMLCFS